MTRTTEQLEKDIIKLWKQTKVVHPSLQEIALKVGCSKQTVHRIVHKHLQLKAERK